MVRPEVVIVTLHADPASPPGCEHAGGTHRYVRELTRVVVAGGWRATILTRRTSIDHPEREEISEGAVVIRLKIGSISPIDKRELDGLHDASVTAARAQLRDRVDVRLFHSIYWNSGRLAVDLSAEHDVPFVHTVISNGRRRRLEGLIDDTHARIDVETRVFGAAATIFCISCEEGDDLTGLYGIPPSKIRVVGRPVSKRFTLPCHDQLGIASRRHWLEFGDG